MTSGVFFMVHTVWAQPCGLVTEPPSTGSAPRFTWSQWFEPFGAELHLGDGWERSGLT